MPPSESIVIVTKIGQKFVAEDKRAGLKAPVNGKYAFSSKAGAMFPLDVKVYSKAQVTDDTVRGLANDALILAAHGTHKAAILAALGSRVTVARKAKIEDAN